MMAVFWMDLGMVGLMLQKMDRALRQHCISDVSGLWMVNLVECGTGTVDCSNMR